MRQRSLLLSLPMVSLGLTCMRPAAIASMTFGGVPVTPGSTVQANVPLSAQEQSYVSENGNPVPPHAVAVLAVPPGFNPKKSWPVLVVFSTSDNKTQNREDLVAYYRESALAEGWVIIAGDGPEPAPRRDTSGWRAGTTLAALDALHRSFPGSNKWPIASAGFSGGAKRAGLITPLLALAGCRVTGIFLTGINEDELTRGYRKFKPGTAFLHTPVFLSTGSVDETATPAQQNQVKISMQRTGFGRVRQEIFRHGHRVKRAHFVEALRWFRQMRGRT